MSTSSIDIICVGNAAVYLYSEQNGTPLDRASTFAKHVGGSAPTTAIGCSRLGLKSALLTSVGDDPMGKFFIDHLATERVNTSLIQVSPQKQTALSLKTHRMQTLSYGEEAACLSLDDKSQISAKAVLFTAELFSDPATATMAKDLIRYVHDQGMEVILSLDSQSSCKSLESVYSLCSLIIGTEAGIQAATEKTDSSTAIQCIQGLSSAKIVKIQESGGCTLYQKGEKALEAPLNDTKEVSDSYEAFISGFLSAKLQGEENSICCKWANHCQVISSAHQSTPPTLPYKSALQLALEEPQRINEGRLIKLHQTLTRDDEDTRPLCLIAFDHRQQMQAYSNDSQHIQHFKGLLYDAFSRAREKTSDCQLGIIVDDQFGAQVQARAMQDGVFCASSIEETNSFPIRFLKGQEASHILRHWPKNRAVKALIRISPQHTGEMEELQWERLLHLNQACIDWGQKLLIEMVVPASVPDAHTWVHQAIQRACSEGVQPTWWKLPPYPEIEMWRGIQDTIRRRTPHCKGILVIGQGEAWTSLANKLPNLSQVEMIRGFAIGRSIWRQAAESWFNKRMEDEAVVQQVAERYEHLISQFSVHTQETSTVH